MKVVFFTFGKETGCFVHAFLNALDMVEAGHEAKIVIEGQSTGLLPELFREGTPLYGLYQKAEKLGIVAGVCKACTQKAGTLAFAQEKGFNILFEMMGHPSMRKWMESGFTVLVI
jgi:hypothetical protein